MKTMTCKELGGECYEKLSAKTRDGIVENMVRHVVKKHPSLAKKMEQMHKEDPHEWGRTYKPKWERALQVPERHD